MSTTALPQTPGELYRAEAQAKNRLTELTQALATTPDAGEPELRNELRYRAQEAYNSWRHADYPASLQFVFNKRVSFYSYWRMRRWIKQHPELMLTNGHDDHCYELIVHVAAPVAGMILVPSPCVTFSDSTAPASVAGVILWVDGQISYMVDNDSVMTWQRRMKPLPEVPGVAFDYTEVPERIPFIDPATGTLLSDDPDVSAQSELNTLVLIAHLLYSLEVPAD